MISSNYGDLIFFLKNRNNLAKYKKIVKLHKIQKNPKKLKKKGISLKYIFFSTKTIYPLGFAFEEEKSLNRALQSTPFQIQGRGSLSVADTGQRRMDGNYFV